MNAGELLVVCITKDNIQTTDGNTNEVTSCTDSVGNTFTKAREFCNGQGGANAGSVIAVYYSVLAFAITTSNTFTANFSSAITAKALMGRRFTIGAGSTISVQTAIDLASDGADPASMAISGLASAEYLFFRGMSRESDTVVSITPTSGFTTSAYTATSGGATASNQSAGAEWKITTGTGATSNPTWEAADGASVFIAFKEVLGVETELIGSPFGASGQRQMSQLLAQ
jgi:hypothetical protein